MEMTQVGSYYTIDFLAKASTTSIAFMSWGHIPITLPANTWNCYNQINTFRNTSACATELALDGESRAR